MKTSFEKEYSHEVHSKQEISERSNNNWFESQSNPSNARIDHLTPFIEGEDSNLENSKKPENGPNVTNPDDDCHSINSLVICEELEEMESGEESHNEIKDAHRKLSKIQNLSNSIIEQTNMSLKKIHQVMIVTPKQNDGKQGESE